MNLKERKELLKKIIAQTESEVTESVPDNKGQEMAESIFNQVWNQVFDEELSKLNS